MPNSTQLLHINQTSIGRSLPYAIIFLILLNGSIASSQSSIINQDLYKWFDDTVGLENTGIYNGIIYKEKFRTRNGNHQFFATSDFVKGSIVYNDQFYYNLNMKYDLYEDAVIIKPTENEYFTIQLVSDKIKSFSLGTQKFIRIQQPSNESTADFQTGFFKINFQGNQISLFEKIKKVRKNSIGNKVTYSSFTEEQEYYLFLNNNFNQISSKKKLVKLLPELKNEINSYYKLNKRDQNKDPERFMIGLIRMLDKSITK